SNRYKTAVFCSVAENSISGQPNFNYDMSGRNLSNVYNSPVYKAERVVRPMGSSSAGFGKISHSGVRSVVTLADDSQYLVHKGGGYGKSSQTVVTDARHMSSGWKRNMALDLEVCAEDKRIMSSVIKQGCNQIPFSS
uniref:Uncharacterized protein n=1 Tax=Stegastes partitus TaxID=144197 RepID=A0A3B5AS44_9TELE